MSTLKMRDGLLLMGSDDKLTMNEDCCCDPPVPPDPCHCLDSGDWYTFPSIQVTIGSGGTPMPLFVWYNVFYPGYGPLPIYGEALCGATLSCPDPSATHVHECDPNLDVLSGDEVELCTFAAPDYPTTDIQTFWYITRVKTRVIYNKLYVWLSSGLWVRFHGTGNQDDPTIANGFGFNPLGYSPQITGGASGDNRWFGGGYGRLVVFDIDTYWGNDSRTSQDCPTTLTQSSDTEVFGSFYTQYPLPAATRTNINGCDLGAVSVSAILIPGTLVP
jgi:hypothetical protein